MRENPLDPTRSHEIPERHFRKEARLVLMVDRYSAYKAMVQVKQGGIVLVFCWAHMRRDFVEAGKGWPELKKWALAWPWRKADLSHPYPGLAVKSAAEHSERGGGSASSRSCPRFQTQPPTSRVLVDSAVAIT